MQSFTFWTALAGAAVILVMLQTMSLFFLHAHPDSTACRRFQSRTRDWWYVLGAIALCHCLGPGTLIFCFALASFMALREVLSVTPFKPSDATPLFIAFFIAAPAQYILLSLGTYGLVSIFIPVYIFFALTALAVFAKDKTEFLARNARIQWALMVTVYGVSFVPALLTLAPAAQPPDGMMLFFFLFVGQLSEAIQFLASRAIGKAPFTDPLPKVTPQGATLAIASSFAIGAAICLPTPFTWWQAGLSAMAISISGLCGTLAMTAAKESLGIKLWRPASEAHGGMTERIDAICFSAPIFFHIAKQFFPG